VELIDVVAYMGEPGAATPSVSAERMILSPGKRVLAIGAQPGVGGFKVFRVPELSGSLEEAPDLQVQGDVGYEGKLGAYVSSSVLVPVNESLSAGANIDLYTARGLLVGPAASYDYENASGHMRGRLDSGWISDQGDRGYDYFGRAVPMNRWFMTARHQQVVNDKVYVTAYVNLLSDPDMLRDFRPEVFKKNQYPDSYVEVSMPVGEDFVVSALTRFSAFGNDYAVSRRLPELRVDMLTNPLPLGGIYQTGFASFAVTNLSMFDMHMYNQRAHAFYGLMRPFSLAPWLALTPKIGALAARYDRSIDLDDYSDDSVVPATHYIGELGLDLTASFHARWDYRNKLLGIDGLRHILRPVLKWRRYGSAGDDERGCYDSDTAFSWMNVPGMDLRDIQEDDLAYLNDPQVVRMGVENVLQTRAEGAGSRALAALNMYHDHYLSGSEGDRDYVQLSLTPASYLAFSYETGFDTDPMHMYWQRARLALKSADQWSLNLYADFAESEFEDYMSSFFYQFNRTWGSAISLGYDAREGEVDRASISLLHQVGSFWQIRYRISFNKDDLRQDDFGFSIAVAAETF
ncbi:MAG: LPS assembly protein LptD, partial [Opitutales bacterium]|jgi:LPS-assembly protein